MCRKTADAFTPFIDITAVEMTSRSLQRSFVILAEDGHSVSQ